MKLQCALNSLEDKKLQGLMAAAASSLYCVLKEIIPQSCKPTLFVNGPLA